MHPGNSIASRDQAFLLHPYTNLARHEVDGPLVITSGSGVHVYDETGKEYIEALAGLWCASLGFSEERLAEAAYRQMRKLPFYHVFNHKSHEPAVELAERLITLAPAPMSKVLFANSGSEANDTAIKLVRYYNNALGRPRKKTIISRAKAYHGVTIGAASLSGLPNLHRDFDLPIPGILHTLCPHHYRFALAGETEEAFATRCADSLEEMILEQGPETIAAFIAEPVMGAGGVIPPPRGYFEKVQAVLNRYDVLMVADEVICGFGRTGSYWGSQTYAIVPDILCAAKALSSAYLPISAVLISERVFRVVRGNADRIGNFAHGFTYSGHPVSAAVAMETLRIYDERDIPGHVRRVAPGFLDSLGTLRDHPLVGEVRGVGLMAGVELVADKASRRPFEPAGSVGALVSGFAQERGLLVRALLDTIALTPPLIVNETEIAEICARLKGALDDAQAVLSKDGRFAA